MLVFGKYEAIKELSRPASGPVYEGCPLGNKADTSFLIKTFNPTGEEKDPAQLQLDPRVGAFLERISVQQKAAEGSNRIAPILESGISIMGAFYVSTLYPSSIGRLIRGKVRLDAIDLHAVVSAVVEGLIQIRTACKQAHGDLEPESVLLGKRGKTGYSEIVLAEPQTPQLANKTGEAGDVRALANMIYQLVTFRTLKEAGGYPAQYGPEWGRLKKGKQWMELVNWVLDPARPADELTLDALADRVARLKVGKNVLKPLIAVAAVLVLAVAIGLPVWIWHQNKADHEKWAGEWSQYNQEYNSWFASLYGDVKGNLLDESDDWVKQAIVGPIRGHEGDFDLNNLAGSGTPDASKPPADPDVRKRTENALKVATRIKDALVGQKKDWKALEKVQQLQKLFKEEGWDGPSQVVEDAMKQLVPGKSLGHGINAVVAVYSKAAPIEAGAMGLKAELDRFAEANDPVLAKFRQYCADQINGAIQQALKKEDPPEDARAQVVFKALQEKLAQLTRTGQKAYDFARSGEIAGVDLQVMAQSSSIYKEPLSAGIWDKWVEETSKYPKRPDIRKTWDSSLAGIDKGIGDLRDLAQEADQADFADLARLQAQYAALDAKIKEVRGRPWRKETFAPIEAQVAQLTQEKATLLAQLPAAKVNLEKQIAAWRERMQNGFDNSLAKSAGRTFNVPSPSLAQLGVELRDAQVAQLKAKAANLTGAPKDVKEKYKLLADLDAHLDQVGALVVSLDREMPVQMTLPAANDWEVNAAKAIGNLAVARREELIRPVVGAVVPASVRPGAKGAADLGSDFLTKWNAAKDQYGAFWKDGEAFIHAHERIAQMLDRSYGLSDPVGEGGEQIDVLLKKWPVFAQDGGVQTAIAPITKRVEQLRAVASADLGSAMKAMQVPDQPDLMWAGWRRLRALSWPTKAADAPAAVKAYTAMKDMATRIKPGDAQRSQWLETKLGEDGRQVVASLLSAKGSEQEIEAAIKAALDDKQALGFGQAGTLDLDEANALKLGDRERFNCFLYQQKQQVLKLDSKTRNPEGRQTAAALQSAMLAYIPEKLPIEQDLASGLDALVKDTDDSLTAKPMAGPETMTGFTIGLKMEGKNKVFTIGDQTLRFILVERATDADGKSIAPYYMSATEVSLGLVAAVMDRSGKSPRDLDLVLPTNPGGPLGWRLLGNNAIGPSEEWLAGNPVHAKNIVPMPGQNTKPTMDMPLSHVGPDTAMYFANLLGCRLPTYGEWWAQSRLEKHVPNLRDATWQKELDLTIADEKDSTNRRWPDEGRFLPPFKLVDSAQKAVAWKPADLAKAGVHVPANYDDQNVYFEPVEVDKGFSHLIGNVAEMIWDDRKAWDKGPRGAIEDFRNMFMSRGDRPVISPELGVVGGSAISPPNLGLDRLPWRKPPEPAKGWADVGFRLAFDATKPPIIVRLKDLIRDQKYALK